MKKPDKPIYVTQPSLPPIEEFTDYVKKIWSNRILTNGGPFHKEFEETLAAYLGVKYISLFSNGTLALVTALKALHISGEVITTPFSFVATTHSLWWNGIKPVFCDIEEDTYNLDPSLIEPAITRNTSAIMPVHVYGNPCRVDEIQRIASNYGLKVIYDSAHAFGVKLGGIPIVSFGDLSVLSFHATKVFNTFEGGAIICHDQATKEHIDQLKNFGIINETTVVTPGLNAKMNEFQAALGILQLKYVEESIIKRKKVTEKYRYELGNTFGISFLKDIEVVEQNYAYFPIRIDQDNFGSTRDKVYKKLISNNIFSRRYFYPLISQLPMYSNLESARSGNLKIAEKLTQQVLCLPIYPDIPFSSIEYICEIIRSCK